MADSTVLAENPAELKKFADIMQKEMSPEFREWQKTGKYPGTTGERSGERIPATLKEMYDVLDKKVDEELGPKAEAKREELKEEVPDIVVKDLDEKGWENLGWPEVKRREVISLLRKRLGIGEHQAERAMHIMIAQGETADNVILTLRDDSKYTYYSTEDGQKDIQDRMREEYNQRFDGVNADNARKFLYLQDQLGIKNDVYIMRFILDDEYVLVLNHMLRDEYIGSRDKKGGLYDMAWNIGFSEKDEFGMDGKFPILQMQVKKKEDGTTEGRYVVNQANFMRWMRHKMYSRWEEMDTDDLTNYFSELKVDKGQFTSVSLAHMILESDTYFRDETGHKWNSLYNQALLEPWMLMTIRQYYLQYEKAMSSEEELMKTYNSEYYLSKLSRKIYGKSMINILMTLPEDFQTQNSDTKLGQAWTKMYLIYYNMSDFDELEKQLGKDSPFFTKEHWMKAIAQVYGGDLSSSIVGAGVPNIGTFLGSKESSFAKAFAKGNTITDKKAFLDFINFYPNPTGSSTVMDVVNTAVKNAVKHMLISKEVNTENHEAKEELVDGNKILDDISLNYGWLIARTMTLPTGVAAKNNWPGVSGHLAETKWLHTRMYRDKYIGYGGAGNPYTVHMFKKLGLPLLESILLENTWETYISGYNSDGTPIYKKRNKTPMEVIRQMNQVSGKYEKMREKLRVDFERATDDATRKKIQMQLDMVDDYEKTEYKQTASQLVFVDNAMRNWAQNIVGRAKVVYDTVMGGSEINFEDFTKYDGIFRGVSFERDKWQKAIQGGLITPLRYLIEANGATQFNMKVRDTVYMGKDKDGKSKWEIRDMYLGEAMFGHQILDIPQFRKTLKEVSSAEWEEMKASGYKAKGKWIVDPNGLYVIDYNKVQENKGLAYKQWILMKIAGDLWAHIDAHNTDPAYGMEHYMNVIDAVASLPGVLLGDQTNLQNMAMPKNFFSPEQIKWLRKISGTTNMRLFMRHFLHDLFMGDKKKKQSKFGESFSIFVGRIFKGY